MAINLSNVNLTIDQFQRLSADPFVLRVGVHFQQPEHQGHPLRATVASTLF